MHGIIGDIDPLAVKQEFSVSPLVPGFSPALRSPFSEVISSGLIGRLRGVLYER